MKAIQVYDKPMCCSTGVCGPEVDPVLPRFAADLQWLQSQGVKVERFNLAQQPEAFLQNQHVHRLVATLGATCLPLVVIEGQVVSQQGYPSREQLVQWLGPAPAPLPTIANGDAGCCGGQQCC